MTLKTNKVNKYCKMYRYATSVLCVLVTSMQLQLATAALTTRTQQLDNTIDNLATRTTTTSASEKYMDNENNDFVSKMSWSCANNATCLYDVANGILQSYKRGETIHFGLFDVVKLRRPVSDQTTSRSQGSQKNLNSTESGRGLSSFVDFISGNAIRIPIGPMVFNVQRAEDDGDYIELALLKKGSSVGEGRRGDGEGIGGGGGLIGKRRKQHDKKQFQMYIPMYLAATTFGWTLVAAKAVGLLTLKALAVSKIAFIVAVIAMIKKFMDHAHESKMMYQFPEHAPYMMPYAMEYPLHGAEMATSEMYPGALQMAAAVSPLAAQVHPGYEHLGSESHLHHNFADLQHNNTQQQLAAYNVGGLGPKVKREDAWIAKGNKLGFNNEQLQKFNNGEAFALAAAVASAEQIAESDDDDEDDEEDATAARRPLAYNYLPAQNPFLRA